MYRRVFKDSEGEPSPSRGRQDSRPQDTPECTTSPSPGPVVYFMSAAPLYKTRAPIVIEDHNETQGSVLLPRGTVVKVYLKESPYFWWIQADNCNFGWRVNRAELEDEPVQGQAESIEASQSDTRTRGDEELYLKSLLKTKAMNMDILVDMRGEASLKTRVYETREKHWREAPEN